jgi:hypothetical protein
MKKDIRVLRGFDSSEAGNNRDGFREFYLYNQDILGKLQEVMAFHRLDLHIAFLGAAMQTTSRL